MDRRIITLTGPDAVELLQGLVTNDLKDARPGSITYAALLTPQGKYLADFFVIGRPDGLWIDVSATLADDLLRRLSMYRLRSKVEIGTADVPVTRGTGPAPADALADPRHPAMGWRHYGGAPGDGTDWDALRVEHLIPETGIELIPNDSYILEAGFDRLHGVDFRKGCYVGQEVTARMRHKTELKKGLIRVAIDGAAPVGTPITLPDGREAGVLFTQSGGKAIAHMRFDRLGGPLFAGDAQVRAA
ncbi:YgfZ/GcvT domain-containing protein [Paracoccus pacificus]|uniref:YgfZ/GcvT domain-containing protein n=1 Tax=Paracoccus pacificus TaxID=1463598 RepID=A0ABW4RBE0_9RHOB